MAMVADHELGCHLACGAVLLFFEYFHFRSGLARVLDSFQSTYIPSVVDVFFFWSRVGLEGEKGRDLSITYLDLYE